MSKKLFFTAIAGILAIILWSSVFSHPATSQQVDFRVNNLESDVVYSIYPVYDWLVSKI